MEGRRALDVLIVSLGSTAGLRAADRELCDSLARAGACAAIAPASPPRRLRTLMLTDLAWARAARVAALDGIARHRPRAIVYSSTTAALLWPRAGAIRFDAPSAGNRPGRHGLWQRPLERRRVKQAQLLLPWSEGALAEAGPSAGAGDRALVLPVPVEPSVPAESYAATDLVRDIAAITYAANPKKKGLDRVLAAWRTLAPEERQGELLVAGASEHELRAAGIAIVSKEGVRSVGRLAPADYRALLRRARVFVCAPRREDYGIAQLEALADGCMLVSSAAPGPYAALPIARALDARLVSEDIAGALRAALTQPDDGYAKRALQAVSPFRRQALDTLVAERLLARLLA